MYCGLRGEGRRDWAVGLRCAVSIFINRDVLCYINFSFFSITLIV